MSSTYLMEQLRWMLRDDQILDTELWREIYARDASYFNIKPTAVLRPSSTDQVRKILQLAHETGTCVTFRAGGTSLCGQTLGTGLICELRTHFTRHEVRDNGGKIWFEPGLTANQVNNILAPHHAHIGPDPASSAAAMMGGILNNNSSGMQAGVAHNSYHTLSSIEFILADGNRYNSASAADRTRFATEQRDLCRGLADIRATILADDAMRNRIVTKYKIKNVTGYAMNSFVDFSDPMDIFAHLLIGSEGTLAYIASAELNTLPLMTTYSSSLLYFPDVTTAAATAAWLGESGALAVEMMDYASLRSSQGLASDMPQGTTAMLIDYGADSPGEMAEKIAALTPKIKALKGLTHIDAFTTTVAERQRLWNIRDGVFPCVAGARVPGDAVILEDVAAPVEQLDSLVEGVQRLFKTHGYDGAIFGHARDGNIHPLVTAGMNSSGSMSNFSSFIDGLVTHVLSLNGSLKGEHGTGRAMAPFVAKEWGDDIYALMKRVKNLADPKGILNPGVIINSNPDAYINDIKSLDLFGDKMGYDKADRCMECGYCEHACPSRNITLTPRQRLQARRIIARTGSKELEKQYTYIGADTCCSDGSCQMPCPMGINTAVVTDAVRTASNPKLFSQALTASAPHYGEVETAIRGVLKAAVASQKVISPYPLIWASDLMHKIYKQVPHWSRHFPMPARLHWQETEHPDFLYFPACVTRIFGGSSLGKDDLITVVLRIARKAGLKVSVPKSMHGLCCSQIWEHKGDPEGQRIAANATVEKFYELSDNGRIPIFCDTTSCTHTLLSLAHQRHLFTPDNQKRYDSLTILDITQWLAQYAMPKLKVTSRKHRVLLHPTCAAKIMGVDKLMEDIACQCADSVTVPANCYCCGAAGDRGFIFPQVAKAATEPEKRDIEGMEFDGCYSLARTCEISMMDTIKRPYESIAYLIDETT